MVIDILMTRLIYEVMDTSSDEVYYTLGLFLSLDAAKKAIVDCGDEPVSEYVNPEHEEIKVMERKEGWSNLGKEVYRLNRDVYENADGEYRCRVPHG